MTMTSVFHRNLRHLPPVASSGRGMYITDSSGKEYLDASGGAAVSCLGHGHPDVLAAMHAQIDQLAYAHTSFFTTQVAEELAQETFLMVWRKANQFDPTRASAGAWIYTIARNLRVDLLRRERHPDDGCIGEPPSAQRTPEDELKVLEAERRLRDAIENLPREQAEVVRLSYFEDQTHPEIADRLGLPLGTVKSRIRLASTQLRSTLAGMV